MRSFAAALVFCAFGASLSGQALAANVLVGGHGTGYTPSKTLTGKLYFKPVVKADVLPDDYDLRDLGLVTPVTDQGQCGSCWAFGSTSAFEGALLKSSAGSFDLSEQQIVSCDTSFQGCGGGDYAFDFMIQNGQALEKDFPYQASDSSCPKNLKAAAKATSWAYVGTQGTGPTVDELRQSIFDHGVVAISVAADDWSDAPSSGVFTECSSSNVDHLVSVVGWHKQKDGTYTFLVKNSWGPSWGNKGYIEMALGCDSLGSDAAFVVAANTPKPPRARLPSQVFTAFNSPTTVGVHPEAGVTYEWTDAQGKVVGTDSFLDIQPTATETFKLQSKGDTGVSTSMVKVVVETQE